MQENPETHTRHVVVLRRVLPLLAVVGVVALIVGANDDWRTALQRSAETAFTAELAIEAPEFAGQMSDGRRYRLIAARGASTQNGGVSLEAPQLDIASAADKPGVRVTAANGTTDAARSRLSLTGAVALQDDSGNRLTTEQLFFSSDDGRLQAPQRIRMQGPAGLLDAAAFEADTQTGIYAFDKAKLRLNRADGARERQ